MAALCGTRKCFLMVLLVSLPKNFILGTICRLSLFLRVKWRFAQLTHFKLCVLQPLNSYKPRTAAASIPNAKSLSYNLEKVPHLKHHHLQPNRNKNPTKTGKSFLLSCRIPWHTTQLFYYKHFGDGLFQTVWN